MAKTQLDPLLTMGLKYVPGYSKKNTVQQNLTLCLNSSKNLSLVNLFLAFSAKMVCKMLAMA